MSHIALARRIAFTNNAMAFLAAAIASDKPRVMVISAPDDFNPTVYPSKHHDPQKPYGKNNRRALRGGRHD